MKNILVVGDSQRTAEFQQLNFQNANLTYCDPKELPLTDLGNFGVIFDLNLEDTPQHLSVYSALTDKFIFACAVKKSLGELAHEQSANMDKPLKINLFGINALPSFIKRDRIEVSAFEEKDAVLLQALFSEWGLNYDLVADRVGMVTPRIVCMIINEACNVLNEKTADIQGIDLAMKLGTAYPYGPFEWADKIGIRHVYEVVKNLGAYTGDSKYKLSPLLKDYYLRKKKFYS